MFRANFFAHHQEFPTVYSAVVSFLMTTAEQSQDGMQFHPDSAWKLSSKNLHETYHC